MYSTRRSEASALEAPVALRGHLALVARVGIVQRMQRVGARGVPRGSSSTALHHPWMCGVDDAALKALMTERVRRESPGLRETTRGREAQM